MKKIISLFVLALAIYNSAISTEPATDVPTNEIRSAISTLASQVNKTDVYQSNEEVRISFSLDPRGEVTLYKVLDASEELKNELVRTLPKNQTGLSGLNNEIVWLSLKVKANH